MPAYIFIAGMARSCKQGDRFIFPIPFATVPVKWQGPGLTIYMSNVRPAPNFYLPINSPVSGETEMFMSLIVAALPLAQDTPVAPPAAMQTAAAATTKPDMAFDGGCAVMQGTKSSTPDDINGFYPAQVIDGYFNNVHRIYLDISKAKATLLKSPAHGILKLLSDVEARAQGIGPEAGPLYIYRPSPGYLGPDDATLLIEIGGKNYKVHTKFYVVEKVNDNNFYGTGAPATVCAESQPKRVATLTFNQDVNLTQWGDIVQGIASSSVGVEFNQYIAAGSGVTLNFAHLATGALG